MKHERKVVLLITPPARKSYRLPFLCVAWDEEDAENRAMAFAVRYHDARREYIEVLSNRAAERQSA
jgi:hypothetical protein